MDRQNGASWCYLNKRNPRCRSSCPKFILYFTVHSADACPNPSLSRNPQARVIYRQTVMRWVSCLPSTEMEEGVGEGDTHFFKNEKKSENTTHWCRWRATRTSVHSRRKRELGPLQDIGDFYSGWAQTSGTQQFHPQVFVCVFKGHTTQR